MRAGDGRGKKGSVRSPQHVCMQVVLCAPSTCLHGVAEKVSTKLQLCEEKEKAHKAAMDMIAKEKRVLDLVVRIQCPSGVEVTSARAGHYGQRG